eukprot:CAMPEP_0176342496 /NCGR_PEP_ID=MMETSP0126-20121128/3208_1 /TAXON_ID=141414 ORGANISM="Strombidinopsis acuminatum, Strain SPMC142" /NCGR_SAMPLE_ID=MMETSP0126 /ASSEMBLY_ACC=CAM_ASM_000229 /LENGTH=83 /DNA_ID=CAMNT_0017687915 /DNA_START=731 /DNA_END=982 /DNA_ORIENTATION=+
MSLRNKRRSHAERRLKLGFKDNGAEEMDDPIADNLDFKLKKYQTQLKEQAERKPIKVVTNVEGIGKQEYYDSMLRDHEKFRDA